MKKIAIGDNVPTFTFDCTDPKIHSFNDLLGQNIILYFYPRDNTRGCTIEGRDFKSLNDTLTQLNTRVIGVSRDSIHSHEKFCSKLGLPFPLISDPNEKLCQYFGVMIENNFLLRFLLGIERTTFLIDKNGIVKQIWRKVKVIGHANEVLEAVNRL